MIILGILFFIAAIAILGIEYARRETEPVQERPVIMISAFSLTLLSAIPIAGELFRGFSSSDAQSGLQIAAVVLLGIPFAISLLVVSVFLSFSFVFLYALFTKQNFCGKWAPLIIILLVIVPVCIFKFVLPSDFKESVHIHKFLSLRQEALSLETEGERLSVIYSNEGDGMAAELAVNLNTPADVLSQIGQRKQSDSSEKLMLVASNRNTPAPVLEILSHTDDESVLLGIVSNPGVPCSVLDSVKKRDGLSKPIQLHLSEVSKPRADDDYVVLNGFSMKRDKHICS